MKRFFTLAAAALMTSAFATSAFAGWGPNGMFGNADPNARPVGQSSRPSTNPASAPILNPPDPTKNLGAVPGGYKDPSLNLNKAQQAARIAKAKANFDKKQYSPRLASDNLSNNMSHNNSSMKPAYQNGIPFMPTSNKQTSGYGGNNSRGGGYFGNDVLSRGQANNYPQQQSNMNFSKFPQQSQYPTTVGSGYGMFNPGRPLNTPESQQMNNKPGSYAEQHRYPGAVYTRTGYVPIVH